MPQRAAEDDHARTSLRKRRRRRKGESRRWRRPRDWTNDADAEDWFGRTLISIGKFGSGEFADVARRAIGQRVRVFVSYPRARQDLRATFVHAVFDKALWQIADVWTDQEIDPGAQFDDQIREQLLGAEIILLLLTPEFFASKYITDVEAASALEQAAAGNAVVFAVLLDECDHASQDLGPVQLLPKNGIAIRSSSDPATALKDVQNAIKYEAYRRFEENNREATVVPYSYGGRLSSALLSDHDLLGTPFPADGAGRTAAVGAAFGAVIAVLCIRFIGIDRWWQTFLTMIVAGACCGALAAFLRSIQMGKWTWDGGMTVYFSMLYAVKGILLSGVAALLVLVFSFISPTPLVIAICALIEMSLFFELLYQTRSKRLQIYHDVVRLGRQPNGGWWVDVLHAEDEKSQELWEAQRAEEERERAEASRAEWHSIQAMRQSRGESAAAPPPPEPELAPEEKACLDEEFEASRKREREDDRRARKQLRDEARREWRQEYPQRGAPRKLVALFHSEDEPAWRELEVTLREEGVGDLCDFLVCCIDVDEDWRAKLAGAEFVLPLLSARFLGAGVSQEIALALQSQPGLYPVRLEEIDSVETLFGERQFLPGHGAVANWPIVELAWQDVARFLLREVERAFSNEIKFFTDGFPPLKRLGWDVNEKALGEWAMHHAVLGGITSLLVWANLRGAAPWLVGVAMAIPALLMAFVSLYREVRQWRYVANASNRYAVEAILLVVLSRYLTCALVAAVFPVFFLVHIAVSPPAGTSALLAFLDAGIGGGILFGIFGYLASRRKRPMVFLLRQRPNPLGFWFGFRNGVLIVRSAYLNKRDEPAGAIGRITNHAPVAVERSHHFLRISSAQIIRFSIETMIAVVIAWILFLWLAGNFDSRLAPVAAYLALLLDGFLVTMYVHLAKPVERKQAQRLPLWHRLKWRLLPFLSSPEHKLRRAWFWVFLILNTAAILFSAPTAIPAVTLTLVAACCAGFIFYLRYFRVSLEEPELRRTSLPETE